MSEDDKLKDINIFSYSPTDMTILINGEKAPVYGARIERTGDKTYNLIFKGPVFANKFYYPMNATITFFYANEYGNCHMERFTGTLTTDVIDVDPESLLLNQKVVYEAALITPMRESSKEEYKKLKIEEEK